MVSMDPAAVREAESQIAARENNAIPTRPRFDWILRAFDAKGDVDYILPASGVIRRRWKVGSRR